MATGSLITADGLTTMTQVVAGTDLVDDADFNNALANVNKLMGTAYDVTTGTYDPTFTYGWGQGGAGVTGASAGNTVGVAGAGGFKDLQDDVQAMCAFLGVSLRPGVAADVTTGTTISAATWNNLMLNISDCWNSRFSPASTTLATDASVTRTTAWTNTLTQSTTWTFASETDCRAFFNGGGKVGISASRSGGSVNDQNTSWTNKLAQIGDVLMGASTTFASAGTNAGVGFYELTTTDKQLLIYYGGNTQAYYSSDYIEVKARVDSTTNPTQVIITVTMLDAGDNAIDASPDGTLTINARRAQPDASGSGFSFPVPTDAMGAISGS